MEERKAPGKSIILLMGEFRRSLVNLVNNSGLPAPISFMIVKEMATALEEAATQAYNQEAAAYEELTKKENNDDVRSN